MNHIARMTIVMLLGFTLVACGSKNASEENPQPITKYGVIQHKENVSVSEAEGKSNTSVYASVSTGGRVSIGIGFLLSSLFSNDGEEAVRYDVELEDDQPMTIYHVSPHFEVGDCVQITVFPDEEEQAPDMVRSKDGCQS